MKLVRHERYQGVTLTDAGKAIALEIIRHHRLLELYLFKALGVPWDGVHEEAEKLEHVISEDVEARMDEFLGYPTADPHGAPIPDKNGVVTKTPSVPMTDLCSGQTRIVAEVSDTDSAMLRHLGSFNLYPGTAFRVIEVAPFEGPFTIDIADSKWLLGVRWQNIFLSRMWRNSYRLSVVDYRLRDLYKNFPQFGRRWDGEWYREPLNR